MGEGSQQRAVRPNGDPVSRVRPSSSSAGDPPPAGRGPVAMRGEIIGRYRVSHRLASGGFGSVYLASMEGPGGFEKFVALKRIHPHLAEDPAFVEMFLDEARLASRITHPNVCSVYDFGGMEGNYFLAMDYVMGTTFGRVQNALATSSNPERTCPFAAWAIAEAAAGLHAAHEATDIDGRPLEVVHRDVSPGNLFVTWNGHVKILDFGIAKAARKLHTTGSGVLRGSVRFMSPEQLRTRDVDRRSDVWSLGVLLWEMLTGRPLFERETDSEIMFAVLEDPVLPPSQVEPSVPAALDAIVMRALERDVHCRYATAADLERDLRSWLAKQPVSAWSQWATDTMRDLFPRGMEVQRNLLRDAKQILQEANRHGSHFLGQEPAESTGLMTSPRADLSNGFLHWRELSVEIPVVPPEPPPPQESKGMRRWFVTTGAVSLVAAVFATWLGLGIPGAPEAVEKTEAVARTAPHAGGAEAAGDGSSSSDTEGEQAGPGTTGEAPSPTTDANEATEAGVEDAPEDAEAAEDAPAVGEGAASAAEVERPRRRQVRRAPRRAVASDPGRLNVTFGGGWAEVYVDGRSLGYTPVQTELPAGPHRLRVVPSEGAARSAVIRVRPGQTTRLAL